MPSPPPAHVDLEFNLAMAVVGSSQAPVVLLDERRRVVGASLAFCHAFGIEPSTIAGREFASLGSGEWAIPQLQALLKATASGLAEVKNYEFDLTRPCQTPRRLILSAHKLDYGEGEAVRLLLAIADVTDARIAEKVYEDLLREKGVLLQELQHRVANSLQIIASVLLQSAKRAQPDQARGPLRDADVSVSHGLVVTELVINALKHAFPGGQKGRIIVDYQSRGADWALTVAERLRSFPADR